MSLEPYWTAPDVTLHLGDCRTVMAGFEAESFDAVVCDPPYDLTSGKKGGTGAASLNPDSPAGRSRIGTGGFMGASWDATGVAFDPETWRAVYRVMKPGGWLLAFGSTRTWHRLVCAIEDAGFEIRDSVAELTGHDAPGLIWAYAGGFPKSLDVAKAIDKAAGAVRETVATGTPVKRMIPGADQNRTGSWIKDDGREFVPAVTEPATPEAAEWSGWGTALRPSWEPIAVARKPLAGTVAQNVLAHGTGALNIGACGVTAGQDYRDKCASVVGLDSNRNGDTYGEWTGERADSANALGRWPSNVLFSHSANCQPAGTRIVRGDNRKRPEPGRRESGFFDIGAASGESTPNGPLYGDTETEAWDCAEGCPVAELDRQTAGTRASKPSKTGSSGSPNGSVYGNGEGLPRDYVPVSRDDAGGASRFFPVFNYEPKAAASERPRLDDGTAHPTVKPVSVMSWLCRLVTRPGGLILDPFAGSGATGQACLEESRRCVLIEQHQPYAELIKVRLTKPIQPGMFDFDGAAS